MTGIQTSNSKALFERASKSLVGGVNSPVRAFKSVGGNPLFIKKALGAYLHDEDDNRFVDYIGSFGPAILGHSHPMVVKAVTEALENGFCYGASNSKEIELAELVKEAFPNMDKIRFVNSGTEAVMSAIRLARGYTKKNKIVKFAGNYHGHVDALLAEAGSGLATFGLPGSAGVTPHTVQDTLIIPYNDFDAVESIFELEGGNIAGIVLEPVCGNIGVVNPKEGFLEFLREITKKNEALLIFDEVMTGFRNGFGGVQTDYQINPDITILGKIIGGGMPVGAYGGRSEIMDMVAPLGPVYQAGTLSGNPIAMTCGIATLNILKEEKSYLKASYQVCKLAKNLEVLAEKYNVDMIINTYGSMITPFFSSEYITDYQSALKCDKELFSKFFWKVLNDGSMIPPSQFEAWFVSAAHTEEDTDIILDSAESFFKGLKG